MEPVAVHRSKVKLILNKGTPDDIAEASRRIYELIEIRSDYAEATAKSKEEVN